MQYLFSVSNCPVADSLTFAFQSWFWQFVADFVFFAFCFVHGVSSHFCLWCIFHGFGLHHAATAFCFPLLGGNLRDGCPEDYLKTRSPRSKSLMLRPRFLKKHWVDTSMIAPEDYLKVSIDDLELAV